MTVERICLGSLQACCYLLIGREKQAVVIDPGDKPGKILDVLAARQGELKAILLTHGHFDHVGAVNRLRKVAPVAVYAGKGEEELLLHPQSPFPQLPAGDTSPIEGVCWVSQGDRLEVGEMVFTFMPAPGHTPGGICIFCQDLLFSGDTLFAGGVGRTDLPGGDPAELADTLKKIGALEGNYRIFPGHGTDTTLQWEKRKNPYLRRTDYDTVY